MFFNGLRGKIEKFYVPFFPSTSTPITIPYNLVLCDSRVLDLRVFFCDQSTSVVTFEHLHTPELYDVSAFFAVGGGQWH